MPITLYANDAALLAHLSTLIEETTDDEMPLAILLTTDEGSALATPVAASDLDVPVISVRSERLGRLNFDMIGLVILDMTPEELLSPSGRRLTDILGRLAEDLLTLVLVGPAINVAGGFLADGITAGLNLIPRAVVLPGIQPGSELRALLAHLGQRGLRLLALDGYGSATYSHTGDRVWAHGAGSVTLIGFAQDRSTGQPTARLKLLMGGMQSEWPG